MALIVNLSSIFKLKRIIPDALYPFVKLCNDYSNSRCLCSKTLFGMTNYFWVLKQYYSNQKLFDAYKLGEIKDDQFLDSLLNVFSFLKNNKKVEDPKKLLATAWNEIIAWDEESTSHLKQLIDSANHGEAVYLVSNTNPLNIAKILSLFGKNCPEEKWNNEALQMANSNIPIAIAPNIYLCLSYNYGIYKEGTPGLLRVVAEQLGNQEKITVISQYPKDLEIADRLKLTIQAANDFYKAPSALRLGPQF